jgi:DNA-binding transcriptional regulator LsrR (DeoR family)
MRRSEAEERRLAFLVAQLFIEDGLTAKQVADEVNETITPSPAISREMVYPLLAKARALNLFKLVPPLDDSLRTKIAVTFGLNADYVRVVSTASAQFNYIVANTAAERTVELVRQLGPTLARPVGIGLGPGRASLDLCRYLGQLMESESGLPRVRLHAIGAGSPFDEPEFASTSFFNLLPKHAVDKSYGLFCETLVGANQFNKLAARPDYRQAHELRADIDVICTSMGDMSDRHDLLRAFLEKARVDVDALVSAGWIGSVQYRPYNAGGPIVERGNELRAVTLFELSDFVRLAATKGKHVLLVARQCGACGRTRAHALRPLLENPSLRVFSDLIMDAPTAQELLGQAS